MTDPHSKIAPRRDRFGHRDEREHIGDSDYDPTDGPVYAIETADGEETRLQSTLLVTVER